MSSLHDFYRTPSWLFEALTCEFRFDGDLACDDTNNLTAPYRLVPMSECIRTPDCDCGLCASLANYNIYCNPPYSDLEPWVVRFGQLAAHNTVVALLPVDPSTDWWEVMIATVHELRFLRKRVNFLHAPNCDCKACTAKRKPAGNNKPNVVAIWRPGLRPSTPVVHWGWWPKKGEVRVRQ